MVLILFLLRFYKETLTVFIALHKEKRYPFLLHFRKKKLLSWIVTVNDCLFLGSLWVVFFKVAYRKLISSVIIVRQLYVYTSHAMITIISI